ncbi:MAG TPA: hypothetical protein VGK67_18315 [Myxococcales bacterium]
MAALAALGLVACKPQGPESKSAGTTGSAPQAVKKNPGAIKVEFFVMSQCPFGVDVVNKAKEAIDKMGADIDFNLQFIGTVGPQGELTSMHGPDEVTGDIVQLCAAKYAPTQYLNMILCQNKNFREVAKNWEQCAKDNQIAVEPLKACVTGPEGKQLLTASFKNAEEKKARGSPTMFVNGKPYSGKRSANGFLKGFCNEANAQAKPAVCASIPAPAPVNVTILTDKRCEKCAPERWEGMVKSRVENPVIKKLDYADPEGKAFYESLGNPNANLPMVLFDQSLDADKETAEMFARHLQPVGSYRSLNVGGQWNPACANENGCQLEQCKNSLACRKEMPKKLELFVMSQCPYGTRALDSMKEVLDAFDNKIDFQVHYIGGGTAATKLTSMHGDAEVDEDIRELCAAKHYNKSFKWMDYVLCRNKDIRSTDWKQCATNGIDAKVIEKCFTGDEGKKLLEEDFKVATGLGIGASPTWIANGKNEFSAAGAESIKKALCGFNKNEIKGCEKTLSGPVGGAPAGGGCGAK